MKAVKAPTPAAASAGRRKGFIYNLTTYKEYYLMLVPGILFFLIFCYGPMYGLLIAFQDYYPLKGISGSTWVGFKHFQALLTDPFFKTVLGNTLIISVYKLIFNFPAPILLCLILNEIKAVRFKKIAQSISYLPHFVSWVVVAGIVIEFLSPSRGPVNIILQRMGLETIFFVADPKWFRGILVVSDIWKSIGWGSIVYLAAVTGVDPQLYEAAEIDGAGRIQKIVHVTFPALVPIVTVMFIMESGKILNDSFQQVFNLLNPSVYSVGDVISTFVYRMGIQKMQYSFTTAVDLFKNVISFALVMLTNFLARKTSDYALW
ncbi:MAG: sugar ABC transporter permease [Provencibacterium sp.]|jgi:putative aldouronate transport system permease protein|nr:sugar ABC transporter permease [Provencibacterium sp.]